MPKALAGSTYYSTHETAKAVGVSKPTLLRWIRHGIIAECVKRDRNGWRIFTQSEVEAIRKFAQSAR
jgi:excisionase family DNA binding protein